MEIPTNECRGCAARDEIIEKLSNRIDELTASDLERVELPKTNVEDFQKWTAAK